MMKIKIIAPSSVVNDVRLVRDVFTKNFSGLDKFQLVEGGKLDGTTYRFRADEYVTWGSLTVVEDNSIIELTEEPGRFFFHCPADLHVELLRKVRNMMEVLEVDYTIDITINYDGKPNINFSMAEDVAEMIKTPIHGFSKRMYINRHPNEPFFVLLGRDPQAPELVHNWAELRELCYTGEDEVKIATAREITTAMEVFKAANPDLGMSVEKYEEGYRNKNIQQRDD